MRRQRHASSSHSDCRHAFASSRRVSPELCFVTPPSNPRGRREGRVPAGTRGPLREDVAQKNRTAAYRCSQSLGLPCAMVGRLMPCSPGSRTFLLASLASRIWMMLSARLGSHTPPRQLDRSNDGQDHTVLPYARPAISPQFSRPSRRSRKLTDGTKPSSAARPHAVAGSQGLPALPAPSRADAAASIASPARNQADNEIAPQG